MIVAFCASKCNTEPDRSGGANPVGCILGKVFFRLHASLGRHHTQTVVSGSDQLPRRGVFEEIASQLFARESVKIYVFIESVDHVVAIRRDADRLIAVISDRIRVSHQIQPVNRQPFAEMGAGKESLNSGLVTCLRAVK